MSTHSHQQAAAAATVAGFYPSYFQESKQLMSTTPNSVYCDQPVALPAHSDVEQDMANAVAVFSSPSLPPLSQLLPSSAPTTTTQRPSLVPTAQDADHSKANSSTATTERSYSHINGGGTSNNNNMTLSTTTANVTTRPSMIYQPSPTVPSHPKIPSNHHPDMFYRSTGATTATSTTATPASGTAAAVAATANDPYYMAMPSYNPTTTGIIPPTTTTSNIHHPLVYPPSVVPPSSIATEIIHPSSSIIPSQQTNYPPHMSHIPPPTTAITRLSHSQQGDSHPHHQLLPSPPTSYDQYPMDQPQSQKVFSFVSLPGVNQKKRPRRKYHEVERLYHCNYLGCSKSYGTLNHLNAHVQMQDHGPKRHPSEFKELRKMWRKQKRETQGTKKKSNGGGGTPQQQKQQQASQPSLFHHPLPPPPPLPTVLYPPPPSTNQWMVPPPHPTAITHPSIVQQHIAAGLSPDSMAYH
ncbi:hypothetical protein [Absidia glauca]|uniref:C2H2-type domain-containing protein n=1 Tax=Absidia glauca TaxID=4829 RepID=A0A168LWC2_ABSGL|nr:hypothetical protein [Absidia glauca]